MVGEKVKCHQISSKQQLRRFSLGNPTAQKPPSDVCLTNSFQSKHQRVSPKKLGARGGLAEKVIIKIKPSPHQNKKSPLTVKGHRIAANIYTVRTC